MNETQPSSDPPSGPQRRPSGQLEHEILAIVTASPIPIGPARVRVALGDNLAYNTVHTILTRLTEKQLLRRRVVAGRRVYEAATDPVGLTAERMRDELLASTDRRKVLRQFVDSLTDTDERTLRALLERIDHPSS